MMTSMTTKHRFEHRVDAKATAIHSWAMRIAVALMQVGWHIATH
jgi:hypothetical protein